MARIRSIKPEVHLDEELWDLEQSTGLPLFRLFVGLWSHADREGRFEWRPRRLKAGILPYWDGDIDAAMAALDEAWFICRYTVDDRDYGVVKGFKKHQVINNRESPSIIPAPEPTRAPRVKAPSLTHETTRESAEDLGPSQEGKGRERKGGEQQRAGAREAPPPPPKVPGSEDGDPSKILVTYSDPERMCALAACRKFETAVDNMDFSFRAWEPAFRELGRRPPDELDQVLRAFAVDEWVRKHPRWADPDHLAKYYGKYRDAAEGKGKPSSGKRNGAYDDGTVERNRIASLRKDLARLECDRDEYAKREEDRKLLAETEAEMDLVSAELDLMCPGGSS